MLAGLGVDLSESAMDAMIGRTQGWAAGLRMAAMSLAHRADREEAARKLAGDTGTVAEYLLAEVLDTQPAGRAAAAARDTSVVDVLRAGLATALAGPHADRALSFLVHGNAFLEELPEGVGCYRYHDLFRQLLRAQLAYESPERWVELHKVAAAWFAAHGLVGDAARHAALVEEWDLAARYVVDDLSVVSVLTGRPSEGLHEVLAQLPRSADGTAVQVVTAARAGRRGDLKGAAAVPAAARASCSTRERGVLAGGRARRRRRRSWCWPGSRATPTTAFVAGAAAQALLQMQDPARVAAHPEIEAVVEANLARPSSSPAGSRRPPTCSPPSPASADVAGREHAHIDALGHGALLAAWSGDLTRAADLAVRAIRLSSAGGLTPTACPAPPRWRWPTSTARGTTWRVRASTPSGPRRCAAARDPLPAAMLALTRARIQRAGGDVERCAAHAQRPPPSGLPDWLVDQLRARAGRTRTRPGRPDEADVLRLSTRDGRTAPATKVATLLRRRAEKLRSGNESTALRDLDHALRLAAPEQSRRVFREAPDELWQLLRRHDELWRRHAWLTDRRPVARAGSVPQPRSAGAGCPRTTGHGSTSR